ncbi:MAG TPA: BadF/BadG/BcrA/BcrD ATPase family protein [Blastocatellia bacterium]|nr:BadF/BadG/BcrA/BcrD ATPase family protein [Blastocatellia bacterium]
MPSRKVYFIGIDVGSTTVKAVVAAATSDRVLWRDYQRHEARQAEKVIEFLRRIECEVGVCQRDSRIFLTGSGGASLASFVGGRFVQEVNAVSLLVEKQFPEVHSVIELGGQDAKIIIFQDQPGTSIRKKIVSMNDKCAGGTGAVIDKLSAKLGIRTDRVCALAYSGTRLHRVAGRCGVFAETDINSLQKQGVPTDELMASLLEALVLQNLTVLTRGHTLHPYVLLLGGPNTFIRGMSEAWRANIPKIWEERGVIVPEGASVEELIRVPADGQYFGAMGAIEFGKEQDPDVGRYIGVGRLAEFVDAGRHSEKIRSGIRGLWSSRDELNQFLDKYNPRQFTPARFSPNTTVSAFLGIDAGSTSTKAVLLDETGSVLGKAYCLSQGNPIQDTIGLVCELREHVESEGAEVEILGVGTTGYAKDVLERVLNADIALVETVAHARSAIHYYEHADVIVDVGGQDIKLIVLKDGHVKDFMLNTQCSAGNGYFLQATAESLGIDVNEYAERAFAAEMMPEFSYGCAVFLQSDIVNFQRKGWTPEETLAGLAAVLPKNVWLYVAKVTNLSSLGNCFILQGGTQKNLAAVKAQVDYIRSRFRGSGSDPEIIVHQHCGEAGAIGAALEAARLWNEGKQTSFIGLDAVSRIAYCATTSEHTRCSFCKNHCLRTFIDFRTDGVTPCVSDGCSTLQPERGEHRFIIASCEKGAAEDTDTVRAIIAEIDSIKKRNPSLIETAAHTVWKPQYPEPAYSPVPSSGWTPAARQRIRRMKRRDQVRIGIPRAFNMYIYAPFFSAYLESLGVKKENLVYSDFTSDAMYREGARRGAIDPCFPSKVVIAHIHNLIHKHHRRAPLTHIFLPMFDEIESPLVNTLAANACPTVIAAPQSARAAFTNESDVFAEHGITYLHPLLNLVDRSLLAVQLLECWREVLGLSPEENDRAIKRGFAAKQRWEFEIRQQARDVIEMLEREERLGIIMLGRPYHHDPGLNHGIFEEFQKLGYPILSQSTLPLDEDLLDRLFGDEVREGIISHPLDITDVWKHPFSASTSHKIWAAKVAARHPNLIAVEISNFKCGHDAMIYQLIESIIESAGRPYFSFRDIDENKAAGSIKIRVETIDYFLKRYRHELIRKRRIMEDIESRLREYETYLRIKIFDGLERWVAPPPI